MTATGSQGSAASETSHRQPNPSLLPAWLGTLIDMSRAPRNRPSMTNADGDLTPEELDAAPVLGSLTDLAIPDLTDDEIARFLAAINE